MRNFTDAQLQALAGETNREANEQIQQMGKDFGLDVMKTTVLFETAKLVATVQTLAGLLDGTADRCNDDPIIKKVAGTLDQACSTIMRVGVLGIVDSKNLGEVLKGPDRYVKLVEDACVAMVQRLSQDVQSLKKEADEQRQQPSQGEQA